MEEKKEHYGLFLEALIMIDKEEFKLAKEIDKEVTLSTKHNYKNYSGGK